MAKPKIKRVSMRSVRNAFTTTGLLLTLYILIALYIPGLFREVLKYFGPDTYYTQYKDIIISFFILLNSVGTLTLFFGVLTVNKVKFADFWRSCHYSMADFVVDFSIGLLLIFASTYFTAIPLHMLGLEDSALMPIGFPSGLADLRNPTFLLLFVVVTPLVEEIAYRGVFLRVLGRYGNRFALMAVAVFYALAHNSPAEFIPAFVLSYFLGRVTLYNRSIYPAVAIHLTYNVFLCVMGIVPKGMYFIFAIAIFVLFIGAASFIYHKGFKNIQLKKAQNRHILAKLFFFTPSMSFAFILLLIHTILSYLLR